MSYLKLSFVDNPEVEHVNHYEFRNKPFSNSDIFLTSIDNSRLLTEGVDVKRVYDLQLCTKAITHNFLPGDTIGVLPRNNYAEIEKILDRLNIANCGDKVYGLEILKNSTKKNLTLPKHIPKNGKLRDIFTYYIDIRKPPKKLFLKAIIPFTEASEEVKLLERICSPLGSKEYIDLITGKAQTLLGLLDTFPSCTPPIEIILEHSLPLHPRYYSISSSPLQRDTLHITFFVVENSDGTKGVCTGWLEEIAKKNDTGEPEKVPFYFRKPNNFRISTDLSIPIIMVATGTGIAPFIGFLNHRLLTRKNNYRNTSLAYLFYGCRYPDRDYLYCHNLQSFLTEDILTKVYTSFSRATEKKCYVQDKIIENGEEFVNLVLHDKAIIYVCGDTKTVVKGVKEALIHSFVVHGLMEEIVAKDYLNKLVEENRFIADCWS